MTTTVRTQTELDAAIASGATAIDIRSEDGVWLALRSPRSSHVVARGSSHVEARGSSHVEARGSSHVVARGSSHVEARGSSHVVARGSSHVEALESSHVEALESSHVEAWGSSHVEAGTHVAVHLHSGRAQVAGGVLIDLTAVDETNPAVWCDFHSATVADGHVTVYKAVRDDLRSQRGFAYPIGETVACEDWRDDGKCGHGLHFSPSPSQAADYDRYATRFLECVVHINDLRPLLGGTAKIKARSALVVREVDRFGDPITEAAVSS